MVSGYTLARKLGKTNCLTYVPKNINLSFSPLNATVVGSPTINNGVASGFSTSNYLTMTGGSTVSSANLKYFEIQCKVTTPSTWTSNGRIINPTNGADSTTAPFIQVNADYTTLAYYNGSTYVTYIAKLNIASNTTYWFKWVYDGSTIKSYYSTDGNNFILNATDTPTYAPYFNSNEFSIGCRSYDKASVCVWNGSIDLSQSYIKINGSLWWQGGTGALTLKAGSKVYIPNGFDINASIYGSPTINYGAVFGFSSSNYLKIDKTFSPGSSAWGILFQFATSGTFNDNKVIFDASNGSSSVARAITLYITPSMKMAVGLASNAGSSWDIKYEGETNNFTFAANKVYQYKLSFNGSSYKGEVYDAESGTWTTDFTKTSSSTVYSSSSLIIGQWVGLGSGNGFASVIDLRSSYIKINDSIWWQCGSGVPKFDEVVIENDYSTILSTPHTSGMIFPIMSGNTRISFEVYPLSLIESGSSSSLTSTYIWYDTNTNLIKVYYNGSLIRTIPLPILTFTGNGNYLTSINQIFQWCGYIGSTVFVLPGVKGFIPNGFNEDGTYRSAEYTTDRVLTETLPSSPSATLGFDIGQGFLSCWWEGHLYTVEQLPALSSPSTEWKKCYITSENKQYYHAGSEFDGWREFYEIMHDGRITLDSNSKITSLTPASVKTTDDFSRHLLNYNGTRYILKY